MARPVTLFTGQWADLSLEELAKTMAGIGYDGLELACWGDHFEVDKAMAEDDYCEKKRATLEKYDQQVFAISASRSQRSILASGTWHIHLPPAAAKACSLALISAAWFQANSTA